MISPYLRHVQEAIDHLGLVRPEFDHALTVFLDAMEGLHPRDIARAVRKESPQITPGEKRALGVRANAFYSVLARDSLSMAGIARPMDAIDVTLLSAVFGYFRERSVIAARAAGIHEFRYSPSFLDCCGCRRLREVIVSDNQVDYRRPPDCTREACSLSIHGYVDFLAGVT